MYVYGTFIIIIKHIYRSIQSKIMFLVRLSDHLSFVCKLLILSASSQEPLGQFQPNCAQHPWVKGIQVCSNEGSRPFPRGDNNVIAKILWQNLFQKSFSPETLGQFNQTWHKTSLDDDDLSLNKISLRTITFSNRNIRRLRFFFLFLSRL